MATFLFGLLLAVPPILACACFVGAGLHGDNFLARWYRSDMRHRAIWLAFWLMLARYLLAAVLFAYAWKKTDFGLAILSSPLILPERGVTLTLDCLLGLPPGVYPENHTGHNIAACCLTALGSYLLWFWFLNHVNQSLSRYDWQDSEA